MPKRIQRRRVKGWKMPPNTVYVGRPTRWGNVAKLGSKHWFITKNGPITQDCLRAATREELVEIFRRHATVLQDRALMEALRGKDLACWCKEGQPCHADVLLEIANS